MARLSTASAVTKELSLRDIFNGHGWPALENEMSTFKIHTADLGDKDHTDYGNSVWLAASIDGDGNRNIGCYVTADGGIITDDNIEWCIDQDLANLGIDPKSDEADDLMKEWFAVAKAAGVTILKCIEPLTKATLDNDGRVWIQRPDGGFIEAKGETDWAKVDDTDAG